MDKAERGKILRERFKKVVGAFAFQRPTSPKPKRHVPTRTPFRFVYPMGFAGGPGFVGKWVITADVKPEPTISTKRRKGVPAVTLIAAKAAPRKLARKHATAEEWLSEHKRQSRP